MSTSRVELRRGHAPAEDPGALRPGSRPNQGEANGAVAEAKTESNPKPGVSSPTRT